MTVEELQEQLLTQQEANKAQALEIENLKKSNEELKTRNEDLVGYNQKLFMRLGEEEKQPEEKHEETEQELIDRIIEMSK